MLKSALILALLCSTAYAQGPGPYRCGPKSMEEAMAFADDLNPRKTDKARAERAYDYDAAWKVCANDPTMKQDGYPIDRTTPVQPWIFKK